MPNRGVDRALLEEVSQYALFRGSVKRPSHRLQGYRIGGHEEQSLGGDLEAAVPNGALDLAECSGTKLRTLVDCKFLQWYYPSLVEIGDPSRNRVRNWAQR